ncbi:MAG: NAD(P)/FAD-dependent oxidoreductase, partial [Lachnospiraceae bacterium]
RSSFVLQTFVKFGAPENILYDAKPHIGTDVLRTVIKNMRNAMIEMGADVYFDTKLTGIEYGNIPGSNDAIHSDSNKNNNLNNGTVKVHLEGRDKSMEIITDTLVLAIGHSANDTLNMLYEAGLKMEAKDFAVGLRVCHEQEKINLSQYGEKYYQSLPAASYKLTHNTDSGIGVYSFCMCPGGYVVNASSVNGLLSINGMSNHDRGGRFANSAIIMTVGRDDFPKEEGVPECMRGVAFKEELERKAYVIGNGAIPYETLGEYKEGVLGKHSHEKNVTDYGFKPHEAFRGQTRHAPVHEILPDKLSRAFLEGMENFGHRIKGFDSDDCIVAGVESRTSSPVRIPRDEGHMANIKGIYPCGEGAGYAGGIISAAMDGMLIAEEIWKKL